MIPPNIPYGVPLDALNHYLRSLYDADWEDERGVIRFSTDIKLTELSRVEVLHNARIFLNALLADGGGLPDARVRRAGDGPAASSPRLSENHPQRLQGHQRTGCLADEEQRARQRERAAVRRATEDLEYEASVARKLQELYPSCPPTEAARIAAWTCRKHSGRVGRSAAAKELDQQALRLAVIAHIRHEHTCYDELLMRHGDRQRARAEVRDEIERMLARWERSA